MSSSYKTPNYKLPIFIGTDKPSWILDFNSAMSIIDDNLHKLSEAETVGVTKKYVDNQIKEVNNKINALNGEIKKIFGELELISNKLINFLSVGSPNDGITALQYDQLKVND